MMQRSDFSLSSTLSSAAWLRTQARASAAVGALFRQIRLLGRSAAFGQLLLAATLLMPLPARALVACVGDCDGSGEVTVDEIIRGVNIALGTTAVGECQSFDRDSSGEVTVDELIASIGAALEGCELAAPTATATEPAAPTATATEVASATPTATPTITEGATHTPTQRPTLIVPAPEVYRGFTTQPIELSLDVVHPTGGQLVYLATSLPEGASFDGTSGTFRWTPDETQAGDFYVSFEVHDPSMPSLSATGQLTFLIEPLDACTIPDCHPAGGCVSSLDPVTMNCCAGPPDERVYEPVAGCPEGKALLLGRNDRGGFGQLSNCDDFFIYQFQQTGASIFFHVATRCLDGSQPLHVHARLEAERDGLGPVVLFDGQRDRPVTGTQPYNFIESTRVAFALDTPEPYFDLQGAEANFHVEVTDVHGVTVSDDVRLRLTFTPIPDIPDPYPTYTPTPLPE